MYYIHNLKQYYKNIIYLSLLLICFIKSIVYYQLLAIKKHIKKHKSNYILNCNLWNKDNFQNLQK